MPYSFGLILLAVSLLLQGWSEKYDRTNNQIIASMIVAKYREKPCGGDFSLHLQDLILQAIMVGKTKSTIRQNKKYNLRRGKSPSKRSDKMATALSPRNRERGAVCGTPLSCVVVAVVYLGTITNL